MVCYETIFHTPEEVGGVLQCTAVVSKKKKIKKEDGVTKLEYFYRIDIWPS